MEIPHPGVNYWIKVLPYSTRNRPTWTKSHIWNFSWELLPIVQSNCFMRWSFNFFVNVAKNKMVFYLKHLSDPASSQFGSFKNKILTCFFCQFSRIQDFLLISFFGNISSDFQIFLTLLDAGGGRNPPPLSYFCDSPKKINGKSCQFFFTFPKYVNGV